MRKKTKIKASTVLVKEEHTTFAKALDDIKKEDGDISKELAKAKRVKINGQK